MTETPEETARRARVARGGWIASGIVTLGAGVFLTVVTLTKPDGARRSLILLLQGVWMGTGALLVGLGILIGFAVWPLDPAEWGVLALMVCVGGILVWGGWSRRLFPARFR